MGGKHKANFYVDQWIENLKNATPSELSWRNITFEHKDTSPMVQSQSAGVSSPGYSPEEIATQLQVNERTISRDVPFIRQQARENLQRHIH